MNEVLRAFVIMLNDMVVVAPSYFIFEMQKVKTIIQAGGLEEF